MGVTLLLTGKHDPTADYIQEAFTLQKKNISKVCVDREYFPKINLSPIEKFGWIEGSRRVDQIFNMAVLIV